MGLKLVIAEKPSVARSIADVLGAKEKHDGYLTGNGYAVSWCIGHLVGTATPEAYDPKYKSWKYDDLPIFPNEWKYDVLPATKKQFAVLKKLMHDKSVDCIVCATDAGREGELIFRLVYEMAGCQLPFKRLWISSLEEEAILQGFRDMKDGHEYDNLYKAALCRDHADWLVGMNATRLYSILYGRTLKVGRVMSPTLAMIVNREDKIRDFVPEPFYVIHLDTDVLKAQSEEFGHDYEADAVATICNNQPARVVEVEEKRKTEKPPKLYDLTTLQRDANRIYGFTAQQTLDYTQSLYEKKLVTYPRTDSQYLTHDMAEMLPGLTEKIIQSFPFTAGMKLPVNAAQVINDKKVSDHHAIIPTKSIAEYPGKVSEGELSVLTLIAVRLLCAVGDPYIYNEKKITVDCKGYDYFAKGRTTVQMGWKAPWNTFKGSCGQRGDFTDDAPELPIAALEEGDYLGIAKTSIKEGTTTPPRRYTEDSLLAAMESAGNENMPEDAERKGIGTPATRAGILEKLVAEQLIMRKGTGKTKHLVPTPKGIALIAALPEQLQSPLLTAEWEQRLKEIEHGKSSADQFIKEICEMLKSLIESAERIPNANDIFPSGKENLGKCPNCGAAVSETPQGFFCENRACKFGIWKNNRFLCDAGKPPTKAMVKDLLADGQIELKGLKSKNGKSYNAMLIIDCADDGSARIRPVFN